MVRQRAQPRSLNNDARTYDSLSLIPICLHNLRMRLREMMLCGTKVLSFLTEVSYKNLWSKIVTANRLCESYLATISQTCLFW